MLGTYKIANLRLIHNGDWTEKTADCDGLTFGVLGNALNVDGMNYEYMFSKGNSELYSKFKWMNKSDIITEIVGKKGREYREFVLVGKYINSIRQIFHELSVIVLDVNIRDGVEIYTLMTREEDRSEIVEKLDKLCTILEFDVRPRGSIYRNSKSLSNIQQSIMFYAIRNGFFETPRKINLSDLAQAFGMNKTSTNYNLKKAIRETLKNYE